MLILLLRYMTIFDSFHNKKIAILWYGREGKSSVQFFLNIGILPRNITILDSAKQIEWLVENLEYLYKTFDIDTQFDIVLGEDYLDNLQNFDIIVKTPGISMYHHKISPYRKKITSQAQIFFDYYQGKIIAVSGTKGKSTTSTLIYETLKHAKKNVKLIGNIGKPVLDYLDSKNLPSQQDEYVVFEVSSYMLEWLTKKNYMSILLNIYSDHIDRHDWFENYQQAKLNILQGSEYVFIRDEVIEKNTQYILGKDSNVDIFWHRGKYTYKEWSFYIWEKQIFDQQWIILQWEHNMMNISAVVWVCDRIWIDSTILKETLQKFNGLPHRMQNIWVFGGITWIDDAISTTPESTIQAIQTFGEQIDTILLWGTDRGYVFDELLRVLHIYGIRNVVTFPDSGKRIAQAIKDEETPEGKNIVMIRIFETNDMEEAVKFAYKFTKNGKICLLSTASPSYSLWKNFEEKWNLFQQYILSEMSNH